MRTNKALLQSILWGGEVPTGTRRKLPCSW